MCMLQGESIAGPQGPPGNSLVDELRELNSLEDHLLVSRLEHLTAFVGQKGKALASVTL